MLTTSSIVKAVQVCSSKALAAVQTMMATTIKAAAERRENGKILDRNAFEVKLEICASQKGLRILDCG